MSGARAQTEYTAHLNLDKTALLVAIRATHPEIPATAKVEITASGYVHVSWQPPRPTISFDVPHEF